MPDIQGKDRLATDEFQKRLLKGKDFNQASPKMSEYIQVMETYLLVSEKKVLEKIDFKDITLR